jgi:hypothetical protein
MQTVALFICFFVFSALSQQRGNGDKIDSVPNLSERQLLVLTNACRMAPVEYRNLYIGNYQVLLPANYPAVRPLYGNLALNKSAQAHSLDMAFNCGMQHNSCDGTVWSTRIQSYYNFKNDSLGENIAAGTQTALSTLSLWILEVNPSTTPVPVDKASGNADGHRRNIMEKTTQELGCGFAKGTQQYTYFWTQDFAGGKPDFNNPLVAGCHFFIESGKTTFFVNYYDSTGIVPAEVSCTIDGQKTAMALAMGVAGKGTYSLVQTKGTQCRQFYFSCLRNGVAYRYPEYGVLQTSGEGSCSQDYIAPEKMPVVVSPKTFSRGSGFRILFQDGAKCIISGLSPADYPAIVSIADLKGRLFALKKISAKDLSISLPGNRHEGMLLASVKTNSGKVFSAELILLRKNSVDPWPTEE